MQEAFADLRELIQEAAAVFIGWGVVISCLLFPGKESLPPGGICRVRG